MDRAAARAKPWVGMVLELVRLIVAALAGFFGGGAA